MLNTKQAYEMVRKEIETIIFEEYQKKRTKIADIANILNVIGYKTKTGRDFTEANVYHIAIKIGCTLRQINKKKKESFSRYVFVRLTETDYQSLLNVSGDKRRIPKFIRNQILNQLINRKEN